MLSVRSGAYDPLKIDVWSVGATVWELAEAAPPFSDTQQPADRWPTLGDPALYPPTFHDFLRLCSEPAASRPTPGALLEVRCAVFLFSTVSHLSFSDAVRAKGMWAAGHRTAALALHGHRAGTECGRPAARLAPVITDDFLFDFHLLYLVTLHVHTPPGLILHLSITYIPHVSLQHVHALSATARLCFPLRSPRIPSTARTLLLPCRVRLRYIPQ
jgi:serine/threonine protein kinase